MSREICQICCGVGEIDRDQCPCCSDGFKPHTSSKPKGDPVQLAEEAIRKVFPVIDENRVRHDSLHNHGKKQAFVKALTLLRTKPVETAINEIFDELCRCEDRELQIDEKLKSLEPVHACR